MTEDPRYSTPDDAQDDDEITPEEFEAPAGRVFQSQDAGQDAGESDQDDPGDTEAHDDEISLDELDGDSSSLFEVAAMSAADADDPEESQVDPGVEQYEVQAAPAGPRVERESRPPVEPEHHAAAGSEAESLRRLHNVEVEVIATLGTTRMQIQDILGLQVGSVVELHRMVGESVDVTLNGRLIARGEVVVVDEKFAIRVNEIIGNGE